MDAKKKKQIIAGFVMVVVLGILLGILIPYYFQRNQNVDYSDDFNLDTAPRVSVVAENLEIPWSLDFLPDGSMIFTERPGRVRFIYNNLTLKEEPIKILDDVSHVGEGGLLGIVLHPNFTTNKWVYIYFTYEEGGKYFDQVVKYELVNSNDEISMENPQPIIANIPGASTHDGGRIKFGPDQKLYITTGDAANSTSAQDMNSLAGKILRLNDDGSIPADNPFEQSPIYSLGHRNPQGLAWDSLGRLWATEHGSTATDELNLIEPGKNYGWPIIRGDETQEGLESPVMHSGTATTWAPSGLSFYEGKLFWVGLRGQTLYSISNILQYPDEDPIVEEYLQNDYGRLRAIVQGPKGFLYVLTSNRDGRNPTPADNDDLILRINPTKL